MKKRRTLVLIALIMAFVLAMSGCGKEEKKPEKEATLPSVAITKPTEPPKAAVRTADFAGCWEYNEVDAWIIISQDGSYEAFEDGERFGPYMATLKGEALMLDDVNLELYLDGKDGLKDSEGDTLFSSTLPDEYYDGTDKEEELAKDFYGCWEYWEKDEYIVIHRYSEGTYTIYDVDGDEVDTDFYSVDGNMLYLEGEDIYLEFDDDGEDLVTSDDYTLFSSFLPTNDGEDMNALMWGEWLYADGELVFYFDGIDEYTFETPDGDVEGTYEFDGEDLRLYDEDGYLACEAEMDSDGDFWLLDSLYDSYFYQNTES